MIDSGSLELAHARMWARWGARPDEALWRRLEVTRELGAMLEIARGSALARWSTGIGAASGVHAIEATLRHHWYQRVAEIGSWMPLAWQAPLRWCALLPELPRMQHLARAPRAAADPARAAVDDLLADAVAVDGVAVRELLDAARAQPDRVLELWRRHWLRRLPGGPARVALAQRLVPLLEQHAAAFASPQTVDGWAERRRLQARLVMLWRRSLLEPMAAFVYLALVALEYERIRGELVSRAAFPHRVPPS